MSVELHHHLVGARHVEAAAHEFAGKVGIHLALVEKSDAVLEPVTLRLQLNELVATFLEEVLVLAPGKQTAGSGDAVKAHQQEHGKGKALHETIPRNVGFLSHGPHGLIESQVIRRYKQNC
jgi:hypothetical protein